MHYKTISNLIIAVIFSIAYTVATLLNILGPLHANKAGAINQPDLFFLYSIIYWLISLLLTWSVYFVLRKKTQVLFFTLIIMGIAIILIENFMLVSLG